jgi:hypothetical protein
VHGFLVLKSLDDKILAAGDIVQTPGKSRLTTVMSLQFRDGSLYRETAVYSQQKVFRLLSYKQEKKGPSFKTQQSLSFDSTGKVNVHQTDDEGKEHAIEERLSLPPDLSNGIITTLLNNVDPQTETKLSMLVATPKPRIVKLRISGEGQDSFSVGGVGAKATHYIIKIDLGRLTGVAAKVVGKQPPPTHIWIASGNRPVFLKSEGPMYEDGPVWRIELASPTWPNVAQKQ